MWWDPHVLQLHVEESIGLRQQRLLEADEGGGASERGVRAHDAWQSERLRVRASASTPAIRAITATEWARLTVEMAADEVRVEAVDRDARRQEHGVRFGTLVHAVLAAVDLDADLPAVRRIVELHARLLGASDDERDAAATAASRALAHPLLRRAAAAVRAGRCRREVPIAFRLEDGALVEGVADLAFAEDGQWTVVDFKTDVDLDERLAEYRRQVALYARAIASATAAPARGLLLRV